MIRWLLGIVLVCVAGLVVAEPAAELFQAEVALANRNSADYPDAIRRALAEVLVTVTGIPEIAGTADGKAIIAQSEQLLRQYRVHTSSSTAGSSVDGKASEYFLIAHFNPQAVSRALKERGLSREEVSQPQTLVWIAMEEQGDRYMVGADSQLAFVDHFRKAAQRRGLPVLFPLMDLEDRSLVRFTDLWGHYSVPARQASARYGLPAFLIGRLKVGYDGRWSSRWSYWRDGEERQLESRGGNELNAIEQGIKLIASQEGANNRGYEGRRQLQVIVEGVESASDYTRVSRYLESLEPVQAVQVLAVTDSELQLVLELQGNLDGLDKVIRQDTVLEALSDTPDKRYRLRP